MYYPQYISDIFNGIWFQHAIPKNYSLKIFAIHNAHAVSIFTSLSRTVTWNLLEEETFLVSNLPDRDIISP